jgi:hypothetical protein
VTATTPAYGTPDPAPAAPGETLYTVVGYLIVDDDRHERWDIQVLAETWQAAEEAAEDHVAEEAPEAKGVRAVATVAVEDDAVHVVSDCWYVDRTIGPPE